MKTLALLALALLAGCATSTSTSPSDATPAAGPSKTDSTLFFTAVSGTIASPRCDGTITDFVSSPELNCSVVDGAVQCDSPTTQDVIVKMTCEASK